MSIMATRPTVINDQTYDRWAITMGSIGDGCVEYGAPSPAAPPTVRLQVTARLSLVRPDGTWEHSPLCWVPGSGDVIQFQLDPYAEADTNTEYAAALGQVIAAIGDYMVAKGLA